jgi:hypothetical protein
VTTIWINQALSSQRETVGLVRQAVPDAAVAASHRADREDILACATASFAEPAGSGAAYAGWAVATAIEMKADLFLAVRGRGDIAEHRAELAAAGVRLAAGTWDPATIALCDRKDLFAAAMAAAGVPVPATRLAVDAASFRDAYEALRGAGTPCVKPAEGVYGRGFWILDETASLMESLMDVHLTGLPRRIRPDLVAQGLSEPAPEPVVVMEFLPGIEHSVDCACERGVLVAAASRRKEEARQVVDDRGPEVELARRVVALLELDGLVNVQTRAGADGMPRVLEVNTRPSGGVGYAAAAGINLPGALARRLLGLPPSPYVAALPAAVRVVDRPVRLDRASAIIARTGAMEEAA